MPLVLLQTTWLSYIIIMYMQVHVHVRTCIYIYDVGPLTWLALHVYIRTYMYIYLYRQIHVYIAKIHCLQWTPQKLHVVQITTCIYTCMYMYVTHSCNYILWLLVYMYIHVHV